MSSTNLIPKDSKDVAGLRNYLTTMRSQACSTAAAYTGPLKTAFEELIAKVDGWIDKLPKTDVPGDWSLESQLDCLFSYAASASACASMAALELSKLQSSEQFASSVTKEVEARVKAGTLFTKESTEAAVATALKAKTDTGELVPKATMTQLCAETHTKAFAEGEKKANDAHATEVATQERITKRRKVLQEASLPLPESEVEKTVLGGTEEDFTSRKATFEKRRDELKGEGIQLSADAALANLWLDDPAYGAFAKTVRALPQLKFTPNLLAATPPDKGADKSGAPAFVLMV